LDHKNEINEIREKLQKLTDQNDQLNKKTNYLEGEIIKVNKLIFWNLYALGILFPVFFFSINLSMYRICSLSHRTESNETRIGP